MASAIQTTRKITQEVTIIIGTVLLLEIVGLTIAILLAWVVSSVFHQDLSRYPWHVVLFVDLAFIVFSAVLAELAEGPAQRKSEADPETRTWILASFIIAVGTLAPLASHAGKIWRDLSAHPDAPPQEATILSEIVCASSRSNCGDWYFAIMLALTVACCVLALFSTYLLRNRASGREPAGAGRPSYVTFGVSVFLFAVYTMLNQKWDVPGMKLDAISPTQLLCVVASMLFLVMALIVASGIVVLRTRKVRLSMRRYRTTASVSNRLSKKLALFLIPIVAIAISTAVLVLVAALITTLSGALPDWIKTSAMIDQLLNFLSSFLYLTLGLIAVSTVLIAIAAILTIAVEGLGSGVRERSEEETVDGHSRQIEEDEQPPEDDKAEPPSGVRMLIGGVLERLRRAARRFLERLTMVVITVGTTVRRLVAVVLRFFIAQRGKARRIAVAALVSLAACLSAYVGYDILRLRPYGGGSGKEALRPSGGGFVKEALRAIGGRFEKAGFPRLTFDRVAIECPWEEDRPAWVHGEAERLQTTSEAQLCSLKEVSVPCWAASIVVAGTASVSGVATVERQRSYDRGKNFARIIERDFIQRCGNLANVRTYVLNLGPYSQGPHWNDAVTQREVYVLVGKGDGDNTEVADAVEDFARREVKFAQYASCEFYSFREGEMLWVRNLKCGATVPGR